MWTLLSQLYSLAMRVRALLYRRGVISRRRLRNPVISVGNLTVGGTGKTPFVAYLAGVLKKAGYEPVILSRGYRGKAEHSTLVVSDGRNILCDPASSGDEPFLLAGQLPGVRVAVGKNRHRSGTLVEEAADGRVIHILDDGFQHQRLKRNLDILLVDATDPFGGGQLLPAGRLREPLAAMGRADLVVITRSHLLGEVDDLEAVIRRHNKLTPISYFYHDAVGVFDLKSRAQFRTRDFVGRRVIALAAIGNPGLFVRDLEHYQMDVRHQLLFPDHHPYSQSDLDQALESLDEHGAGVLMTTEKDAVRLQGLEFGAGRIFVLKIEALPEDPAEYRKFLLDEVAGLPNPH